MDALENIASSLRNWSQDISESKQVWYEIEDIRYSIEKDLYRQQTIGWMSELDVTEMRYIIDKWTKLLHSISMYKIGHSCLKEEIITLLVDLLSINQIPRQIFIDCCLKL